MITRVYRGHHTKGLLAYLYGPGRHEEHRDQHLVACWDGNAAALEPAGFDAGTMTDGEVRQHALGIARALDLPLAACDNHDPQHVYHLVMSNPAADRALTDAEWAEIARDMMDRTGIAPAGDDLGCRWVLVRHGEDHVHLVATLARQDGRKPRLYRDFGQLRACAKEWEARLGLTRTAAADRTAAGAPTIGETKKAERLAAGRPRSRHGATGGQTTWRKARAETPKVRLARAVHAAAARSHDLDSFREELAGAGVTVHLRESEIRPGEVTGVSFSIAGHETAGGDPIRYSGSKLAPDLGWRHLQARWAEAAQASAETTDPTRAGSRAGDEPVWQEAEAIVREAADRIRAADAGDEAADDAAWAAADVAYGFAWYLGGRQTGAAEAMARAGRLPGARRPVSSSTGRALRRMGRTLSASQGRGRSDGRGSWRLVAAMADLAGAVAARRAAQERLAQAAAATQAAAGYERLRDGLAGPGLGAMSWPAQAPRYRDDGRGWSSPPHDPGHDRGPRPLTPR